MKKCRVCGIEKKYSDFHKRSDNKDGYRNDCKQCVSNRQFFFYNKKRVNKPYLRTTTEKQCRICLKVMPLSKFYYRKNEGYESSCRGCKQYREYRSQLKVYGISIDKYFEIRNKNNGRCYTCNKEETTKRHSIDHDHNCCPGKKSCGKCIRGLLCHRCNTSLGLIEDNIDTLKSMISYISKNRSIINIRI